MTLIAPTLMGTISVEADLCITASKERGLDRVQMPALTLIVPHAMGTISVEADLCITASKERGLDRVQMPALTLIVPHALRGNASQDAPRPLSNVAQMCAKAPALSTSYARLTESSVCAICDAERHGMHAHAMGTITALAHCPGTNLNTPSVCSTTSCSLKCCFMYSPLM